MTGWLRGLARIPVTLSVLALLLVMGVVTGTLFAPAAPDDTLINSLEFGLPAFLEGRVWTVFTGAITFAEPEFYLFVGVLLAVGLGIYERRVGSLRAAAALVITHVAGVVIPALLLWPFSNSGWAWAVSLSQESDSGLSAGGIGVAAAGTALLAPPWRGRWRLFGTTVLAILIIKSGLLWDLEHSAAWAVGLAIGPRLARARRPAARKDDQPDIADARRSAETPEAARRETRIRIAFAVAAYAAAGAVEVVYPGVGGAVGPGPDDVDPNNPWLAALELGLAIILAVVLPLARVAVWWLALAVTAVVFVVSTIAAARGVTVTPEAVCAAALLVALVWFRDAWLWRDARET